MEIQKKFKCLSCGEVVVLNDKVNNQCSCGKVLIIEGHIKGTIGTDYIDVSPILLNE